MRCYHIAISCYDRTFTHTLWPSPCCSALFNQPKSYSLEFECEPVRNIHCMQINSIYLFAVIKSFKRGKKMLHYPWWLLWKLSVGIPLSIDSSHSVDVTGWLPLSTFQNRVGWMSSVFGEPPPILFWILVYNLMKIILPGRAAFVQTGQEKQC